MGTRSPEAQQARSHGKKQSEVTSSTTQICWDCELKGGLDFNDVIHGADILERVLLGAPQLGSASCAPGLRQNGTALSLVSL